MNNSKTIRFFSENPGSLTRNTTTPSSSPNTPPQQLSNNSNNNNNSSSSNTSNLSIHISTQPKQQALNSSSSLITSDNIMFNQQQQQQLSPTTLQNTRKFSLNKDVLISMMNHSSSSLSGSSPVSGSSTLSMIDPDRRRSSTCSVDSPTSSNGNNSILFLNLDERSTMQDSLAYSQLNNNSNTNRSINHQRNRHKGSNGISEYSFTVDDLIVPNTDISSPRLANLTSNIVPLPSSSGSIVGNAVKAPSHSKSNSSTTIATFVPYVSMNPSNISNTGLDSLGTTEFVNLDLTSILPHGKLLRFFLINNQDYFTDTVQLRKHSPVIAQEIDFQQRMNEFENQNTGYFSDISIRFLPSGREIHAHKFILSMYSPVLATLFSSRWKETNDSLIEVFTEAMTSDGVFEDIDDEQLFVEMILCMYSGQIYQVEQHLIVPLLELSDKYQFTELSRACEEFLRVHLNEHNCISLLYLANGVSIEGTLTPVNRLSISSGSSMCSKGKFDRLKERALTYIDTHFELVSKTRAFLFLDIETLIFLLNRSELRVDSEDVILNAILSWCDGDLTQRRELLFSTLLEHVRLYHLSPNRLAHLGEVLEKYTGTEYSALMMPWMNRIMQSMSYQMSHTLGFQLSPTMQQKISIDCPPRKRATQDITRISNLLSQEQFLQILEWINELGKQGLMKDISEREWLLLYRGTRDGFQGKAFHAKCDGKGPNFCVIKTDKGFLFGGFTSKSWHSNNTDETDECAFLYSLYNPYLNNKMTRFKIKPGMSAAIGCYANFGVIFGGGRDLILYSESNINNSSHCEFFGHTYQLPNLAGVYYGSLKSKTFFNGTEQFRVNDCEVFGLVPSSNKQKMKV